MGAPAGTHPTAWQHSLLVDAPAHAHQTEPEHMAAGTLNQTLRGDPAERPAVPLGAWLRQQGLVAGADGAATPQIHSHGVGPGSGFCSAAPGCGARCGEVPSTACCARHSGGASDVASGFCPMGMPRPGADPSCPTTALPSRPRGVAALAATRVSGSGLGFERGAADDLRRTRSSGQPSGTLAGTLADYKCADRGLRPWRFRVPYPNNVLQRGKSATPPWHETATA